MEERSLIAEFYAGKTVLITGATGLIGKVLIWKLLRSCPNVQTIYVLVRPKYGKEVHSRVEDILQVPIFNNFREENPEALKKVVGIEGDVGEKNVGLSERDEKKLRNEVNVVFHIAAMLKLDAKLKDAVIVNTEGTLALLNICEKMKNLESFIHTSTAYCHCDIFVINERVYPIKESPYDVIEMVHWMKPDILQSITKRMIKPHPNTYTYTKRLAERIAADFHPRLPVTIVRPSIVIPALKEPIPGWVDNLNGPTGLMIGAGKGVIRTMLGNPEYNADLNPVDIVCNGLIVAAWKTATCTNKPEEIPVYNLTQAETEPVKWREVIELGKKVIHDCPFELALWYPGGDVHNNAVYHFTIAVLFQWLPALLIDFLLLLLGRKRFMINTQKKIHRGQKLLQYFTKREWHFDKKNLFELKNSLHGKDETDFKLTLKDFDRKDFMIQAALVARQYILKEDPNSIPKCKIRMKILYVIDRIAKLTFGLFLAWMVLRFFDITFGAIGNHKPVHI